MTYRKTRRSREQLDRMKAGKDAARMARPAPDRVTDLPDLRRRIVITTEAKKNARQNLAGRSSGPRMVSAILGE
jgi:hypothetical protein